MILDAIRIEDDILKRCIEAGKPELAPLWIKSAYRVEWKTIEILRDMLWRRR